MSILLPDVSSIELASRIGAEAALCRVTSTREISPSVREISLGHEHASRLAGVAGNDVMIRFEGPTHTMRRRYSVRGVTGTDELHLWISVRHDGVGANWARATQSGDLVDVVGPRGKIPVDLDAAWHLFIGDTTAIGAFLRMSESLTAPSHSIFVLEVDHADDVVLPTLDPDIEQQFVFAVRGDRDLGDPSALLNALGALTLPPGRGHAYVFGEYAVSRAVRVALLDADMADEEISLKAFWRAGSRNAEHGEPPKD